MTDLSNAAKWAAIATGAVRTAMETARALGLDPPGLGELEDLKAAANAEAAKLLPAEFALLAIAVSAVAARAEAKIASLGEDRRCPHCSDVLRMRSDGVSRKWTCDKGHYNETELV